MPSNSQRRASETRRFQGEPLGIRLAEYLNGTSGEGVERIADIVERLNEIAYFAELARKEDGSITGRWTDIVEECREKLNERLRHYAGGFVGLSTIDEEGHALFGLYPDRSRFDRKEWDALDWVLRLGRQGLLHRVQRCANEKCERWFFARFDSQTCCTTNGNKCRIQKYRSSEEWKELHREQQKKRYHAKKNPNVK